MLGLPNSSTSSCTSYVWGDTTLNKENYVEHNSTYAPPFTLLGNEFV